jgi:hypothetical protein
MRPHHCYGHLQPTYHRGELDRQRRHAHHHVGHPDERAHAQQDPGEEAGGHALLLGHDVGHHQPVRQVDAEPRAGCEAKGQVAEDAAEDAGHAGAERGGDHDLRRGEAHLCVVLV